MNSKKNSKSINRIAYTGMLFATALVLSLFESMLPVLPMMPPGVKLGLSNIVTMYGLFTLGARGGITIAILKSFFVFLARGGFVAASLSLAGGLTSVGIMLLLSTLPGIKHKYLLLSIFGAIGHNIGQIIVAIILTQTTQLIFMLPVLLISGVIMGAVTGMVLKTVMPYMNRLHLNL